MAIRKRFRILLLAAVVAAVVVPVGFALSLESRPPAGQLLRTPPVAAATTAPPAALAPMMIGGNAPSPAIRPVMSDAAKLFFVGGILFGLAAAIRKTI